MSNTAQLSLMFTCFLAGVLGAMIALWVGAVEVYHRYEAIPAVPPLPYLERQWEWAPLSHEVSVKEC